MIIEIKNKLSELYIKENEFMYASYALIFKNGKNKKLRLKLPSHDKTPIPSCF
jgi:hypothetical protein